MRRGGEGEEEQRGEGDRKRGGEYLEVHEGGVDLVHAKHVESDWTPRPSWLLAMGGRAIL